MFLRACVRVFCLETCLKKYFADAKPAVKNIGVHHPLLKPKIKMKAYSLSLLILKNQFGKTFK